MCLSSSKFVEYQAHLALEPSGPGSGDDEDADDKENSHQEDFTLLEELRGKNTNGVEMKEEFVPFGEEHG